MRDNVFWCVIITSLMTLIATVTITGIAIDAYRDCQYIKAGYTRKMLPGHSWPEWVNDTGARPDRAAPGLDPRNWIVSEPVPLSNAAGGGR